MSAEPVARESVPDERLASAFTRPKRVEYRFRQAGWAYKQVDEERVVHSLFDQGDLDRFARNGFMVVEDVFAGAALSELRDGVDTLRQQACGDSLDTTNPESSPFHGQYLLEPVLHDERVARLLQPEPIVDTVRSLLGPSVMLRTGCGRVTFPGRERMETGWHVDSMVAVSPQPLLPTTTPIIGLIIYLDDVTEASGPTLVVPGSHLWNRQPEWYPDTEPDSLAVAPRAGSVLFFHAALWHRAAPNREGGATRRVLILHFAHAGTRRQDEPTVPAEPGSLEATLVDRAQQAKDEPMLEVLGRSWY